MNLLSVDTIAPILRRGVLLDIAGNQRQDVLSPDFCITPEHMERAAARIGRGDVVLLRTGGGKVWEDAARYVAAGPGPGREGAEWRSSHGMFAAGADTVAFETVPSGGAGDCRLLEQ